ncbi:MAG: hypothetical protein RLZZ143_2408 [Cyanobacteriota bacterium]|jgi:hypothetical protein
MSDEGNNILKIEDNFEKQKLLLEQKRIDQEKELKLKELEILKKQAASAQWTVPIVVALSRWYSWYREQLLEQPAKFES